MEKELVIHTPDKKKINARLRGPLSKPLIILVHGLGGNMDEALHYNAARFFERQGFSSLRFNQYDWEKGFRKLRNCTLKSQAQDLDTVITYLRRKGAKTIFVIGHSYGAPTILKSEKRDFEAAVFWDGSHPESLSSEYFLKCRYYPAFKGRLMDWGFDVLVSEKMVQEAVKFDTTKLIKNFHKPILFAQAGASGLVEHGKMMYEQAKSPKRIVVIKKADHNFTTDGAQEKLYAQTVKWLKGK